MESNLSEERHKPRMSSIDAILGIKRALKTERKKSADRMELISSWRSVAEALRDLSGLDEQKYRALLKSRGVALD